jgi:hypothetical protein
LLFAIALSAIPLAVGLAAAQRLARRRRMPAAARGWQLLESAVLVGAMICALAGVILWAAECI